MMPNLIDFMNVLDSPTMSSWLNDMVGVLIYRCDFDFIVFAFLLGDCFLKFFWSHVYLGGGSFQGE